LMLGILNVQPICFGGSLPLGTPLTFINAWAC
jgi:hypothetical protein